MPKDSHPELFLSSLLKAVYWVDESLQTRLEAAGWPRLSRSKSMIMVNVFMGITRPIELARNIGVSRQAIHQTLQEMVKDKLLELQDDPNDKRAIIVGFHSESHDIMVDTFRALTEIENDLASRVGKRNLQQMRATLEKDWGDISIGDDG
jgi:DNA-binding MarR family transcriptional regulator